MIGVMAKPRKTCSHDLLTGVHRRTVRPVSPTPMTDRYLTISDAEKFTGKSRSTLRRFLDSIVKQDDAPDRHLILPTVEEVTALRQQNQPFSWKLSEELLRRQFLKSDETEPSPVGEGSGSPTEGEANRLITVLEKSIALLERELGEKNTQMAAMNERLRESNILMKDLQARLALPAANPQDATITTEANRTQPETAKANRRSFGWLFGK